jgi:hypothetical protein
MIPSTLYRKLKNIPIATSWDIAPRRNSIFGAMYRWSIPTGISSIRDTKFHIPRNIPTIARLFSWNVKKKTTVK